jgi:hypothetical protein
MTPLHPPYDRRVALCRMAFLAGLCCLSLAVQAGERPSRAAEEAIRKQQIVKRRYQELTRMMGEVSRKLEATDPKTAAAIAAAAQRAEAALIADEMDKVIGLLQEGMVIPADATQAKVIQRLREVLNALRGEDGLEWRLFLLQELQQQLADLGLLIDRQRVLERISRMLAFGDEMRAEITATRGNVDATARDQEGVLERSRRLAPSPAAMRFAGARQGIAGMLRRFETARDALWNPTPAPDELVRNTVNVRRHHAEATTLRADIRSLLHSEDLQRALETLPADRRGQDVVESVGRAADELDKSAKAMTANDLKEGLLALSEAKLYLQDALRRLDETLQDFSDVKPAVKIAADQKKLDDTATQLEPAMRKLFPSGLAQVDDAPGENERVPGMTDRLAVRPSQWAQQAPVLLALDPLGTVARQEQFLSKLRDWSARLEDSLREMDRLKEEPRYPAQKKDQESITSDLRAILDINRRREGTVGDDAELSGIFSALRAAIENAADASAKAAEHLGQEQPKEANPKQNEVIHLLTTVRDRIAPELKMDKNKYAMNEQMLARIQRMIIKQTICLAQTKAVWEKRPPDGHFGRTEQLRIEAIARDEASLEDDIKFGWEIINTAHNVGYGLFPPEARVLLELARSEVQVVVKMLQVYDPGTVTQQREEVVLGRLKAIAKLLDAGFGQTVPELDRKFTYDSFLSRMSLHNTRVNIIGLLVTLQEDINRRIAVVDGVRRSGKADASTEQEAEQLRQLQEHVRKGLEELAWLDARSWMGADWMPTQYGSSRGGAKQGPVAPSIRR